MKSTKNRPNPERSFCLDSIRNLSSFALGSASGSATEVLDGVSIMTREHKTRHLDTHRGYAGSQLRLVPATIGPLGIAGSLEVTTMRRRVFALLIAIALLDGIRKARKHHAGN